MDKLTHDELAELFSNYKKCPRCKIVKNVEEEYSNYRSECKVCRSAEMKNNYLKKKQEKCEVI